MSDIAPFGWLENEAPDIDATNLEKDRNEIGKYAQEQASIAEAASIPVTTLNAPSGAAKLGTDSTVGGPGGSPLSSSVVVGRASVGSGDTTGATDTTAIAAAMPAQGTLILRNTAPYYVTRLPTIEPGKAIQAEPGTVIFLVGSGTCLRFFNPTFPTSGGVSAYEKNMPGRTGGFVIDLTHSSAGAVGVQAGDIYCLEGADIIVRNGTGAGTIGWLFQSEIGWCERVDITNCHSVNNSILLKFANTGTGTGSFDYSHIEIGLQAFSGQHGIVMEDAVQFTGGHLRLYGNFYTGESNTGVVWKLGADNSAVNLIGVNIDFHFETDGSVGTGHKTLEMGTAAESHTTGIIWYQKGGTAAFTQGNQTSPNSKFTCSGLIRIDHLLGENAGGEGLNVLGGSTWSPGFSPVSGGKLELGVNGGDFFLPTLASGANIIKLNNVSLRPHRIFVLLTQPATGAAGTIIWTEPGNNIGGVAQSIIWTASGGSTPVLSTANGAVDLIELVTLDGQHWYGTVLGVPTEAITASKVKPGGTPPGPVAENEVTMGTAGIGRKLVAAIEGNGSATKFKIKHSLETTYIISTALTGSKEQPVTALAKIVAISASEVEVTYTTAPGAGVVNYVVLVG